MIQREPKNFPCDTCHCDAEGRCPGTSWSIKELGLESDICPRKLISERTQGMLWLYQHYKNGVLPVSGGLLEQPYAYSRAMTIIDYWLNRPAEDA